MRVSPSMHENLKYSSSKTNFLLEQPGKNLSRIAQLHSATYPVPIQVIQNQMKPQFQNHMRPQFQNHTRPQYQTGSQDLSQMANNQSQSTTTPVFTGLPVYRPQFYTPAN